ncbi:RNA polymerase factor sigma-54 [uncultured Robinsoniella sp.]|uniref:RNA polymerase factor sigma-54 n=1 Tax=uncultured Robinsoniella sp. TaxID=904190 RepID=UPI00374E954A
MEKGAYTALVINRIGFMSMQHTRNDMELQVKMSQQMNMSQRMIQSVQILQMTGQELETYVKELAMENPLIDLENMEPPVSREDDIRRKLEWLEQMNEENRVYYNQEYEERVETDVWGTIGKGEEEDLQEYLLSQLLTYDLDVQEHTVMEYMIACIDQKGYFTLPLDDVCRQFQIENEKAKKLLHLIQGMEPAGIGCRDLRECLLLQIDRRQMDEPNARKIIDLYLDLLGKNQMDKIAKKLGASVEEVLEAYKVIQSLNPKPGNSFYTRETLSYIVPDITVVKLSGYYEILLNEYMYPRVIMNTSYCQLLKKETDQDTKDYVQSKLKQAEWVRNCISQRNTTMIRVVKCIVDLQEDFFAGGKGLKTMCLSDVADRLEIHASTVSRALQGKYLQCTWGIFPLNYFFSKGVESSEDNGLVASAGVQERIKEIVAAEDKKKPLSDQKITERLVAEGIRISRRTVAKYRDACGIRDACGRKKF